MNKKTLIAWAIFGIVAALLIGIAIGGKYEMPSLELRAHGSETYPRPYKPVIYYRIDESPFSITVRYACADDANPPQWITWETLDTEFKEYLPRHTWWIDDPQGAR